MSAGVIPIMSTCPARNAVWFCGPAGMCTTSTPASLMLSASQLLGFLVNVMPTPGSYESRTNRPAPTGVVLMSVPPSTTVRDTIIVSGPASSGV